MSSAAADGGIYHNGRTYAEHCAWLDSLEGDDYRIVYMPVGHLYNLAYVAYWKHFLLCHKVPLELQLKTLSAITECAHGPVTTEAVAAIEPSCEIGVQMMKELQKVETNKRIYAFQEGGVFRLLAKLNPSLLRALALCQCHPAVPERRSA